MVICAEFSRVELFVETSYKSGLVSCSSAFLHMQERRLNFAEVVCCVEVVACCSCGSGMFKDEFEVFVRDIGYTGEGCSFCYLDDFLFGCF